MAALNGQEAKLPDKFYKCCKSKTVAVCVCVKCHSFFHGSCVERSKISRFISKNEIICCEDNITPNSATCDSTNLQKEIKLLNIINGQKDSMLKDKEEIIALLEHKIKCLEDKLKTGVQDVNQLGNKTVPEVKKSYSAVLNESVVIVKPKNSTQKSQQTREMVQEKINPVTVGASVSRIKHIRDGGIAICCSDEKSIENICEDVKNKLGNEYDITTVEKKNPKIKIFNVNAKDLEDEESFVDKLVFQNTIKTNEEKRKIKVANKYETHNGRNYNVIVEVDSETYGQLNSEGFLHIGWKRCRFIDFVNLIQCYKCWKFGHLSKNCKSPRDVCPNCGGDHSSKNCNVDIKICTNCRHAAEVLRVPNITFNHSAYDRQCESYKRIFSQLKNKFNYAQGGGNNVSSFL